MSELLALVDPHRVSPDYLGMLLPGLICQPSDRFHIHCFQYCSELSLSLLFIHVLAPLLSALHSNACGVMDDAHSGLHLIHILAAISAAVELLNTPVLNVKILYVIFFRKRYT